MLKLFKKLIHDTIALLPKRMQKPFLSCQEASNFIANKNVKPGIQTLQLKIHLFICQCCTDFSKQMNVIETESKKLKSIDLNLNEEQKKKVNSSKEDLISQLSAKK